ELWVVGDLELGGDVEESEIEADVQPAVVGDQVSDQPAEDDEDDDQRGELADDAQHADVTPQGRPGGGWLSCSHSGPVGTQVEGGSARAGAPPLRSSISDKAARTSTRRWSTSRSGSLRARARWAPDAARRSPGSCRRTPRWSPRSPGPARGPDRSRRSPGS